MSNTQALRQGLITAVLNGEGATTAAQRRSAFENSDLPEPSQGLVEKVAKRAHEIGDQDIAAVLAAGLTEDQVFELVVCAAVGEATRQVESARAALDQAIRKG